MALLYCFAAIACSSSLIEETGEPDLKGVTSDMNRRIHFRLFPRMYWVWLSLCRSKRRRLIYSLLSLFLKMKLHVVPMSNLRSLWLGCFSYLYIILMECECAAFTLPEIN